MEQHTQAPVVGIIGAGLAGLVAAHETHKLLPQATIKIYEAEDRIGGKLRTVAFEHGPVDMGAEAYLAKAQHATDFFTELGLADRLREPSGMPSMLYLPDGNGELKPLPRGTLMGIPAAAESVAHLVDEATARRIDEDHPVTWQAPTGLTQADASVADLVREVHGDQVLQRIVEPLLGGVYASSPELIGVRAALPRLAEQLDAMVAAGQTPRLTSAVKTVLTNNQSTYVADTDQPGAPKKPVFSTFAGGYADLYETLAEQSGAEIYIDAFISDITPAQNAQQGSGQWTIRGQGINDTVDALILAVPAPTAAALCSRSGVEALHQAATHLRTIPVASSTVVGLRLPEGGLPDYSGILVSRADNPTVQAKAFTFSSKKWPHIGSRPGDLVRVSYGRLDNTNPLAALTDIARADEDTLVDAALDDLHTVCGLDARTAGVEEIFVQRWYGGLPCYQVGHAERIATIDTSLQPLGTIALTGAWKHGVGVPAIIEDAQHAAHHTTRALTKS